MCSLGLKGHSVIALRKSITDGGVDQPLNLWQRSKWQILRQQYPVWLRTGGAPASKCGQRIIHSVTRTRTQAPRPLVWFYTLTSAADMPHVCLMNERRYQVGEKKKMACRMERTGVHFWILHNPIKGRPQTHTFHLHSMQTTTLIHITQLLRLRDSIKYFILS